MSYGGRYNPNYEGDKLGLEVRTLDERNLSYEYNTMLFVRPAGVLGQVYMATDSGCSCPTPFEDLESATQEELFQKMERVPSLESARHAYDEWSKKQYEGDDSIYEPFEAAALEEWF